MGFKLVLVALLVISSQLSFIEAKNVDLEIGSRGLLEDALKALDKLEKVLQEAVNSAVASLGKLLEGIRNAANKVIQAATDKIEKDVKKFIEAIEKLKKEAEELGINIAECFGNEVDDILALKKKVIADLVACVTNKVNEATKIVTDTIAQVNTVWTTFLQLRKNLEKCKVDPKCILLVLTDIAEKTVKLPAFIVGQVSNAKKLIENLHLDITKCGADALVKIPVETAKILASIVGCIHNRPKPY